MNKQLWILIKYEIKKLIKNPMQIFFLVVFPVMWLTVSGVLWGTIKIQGHYYIELTFSSFVAMEIIALTISKIPTALAQNRGAKTLKHFAVLKIKKSNFLLSIFIVNYVLFVLMFFLLVTIASAAFHLSFGLNILYMFMGSSLLFVVLFYFGMIIISISKRLQTTMTICYIMFYLMLFLSGAAVPAHVMGDWFIYVQKITPAGNGVILLQNFNLGVKIKADVFPIIYLAIASIIVPIIAIKKFKYQ